ncbi:hypothetical protein [Nocardioides sp. MH1]|uniref:hypothetical protein n=1 Tax=Nocardioides sp. MH1 TaxID=3242490 RepID=UPI00352143B2
MPRILGMFIAAITAVLLVAPTVAPAHAEAGSRDRTSVSDRALPQRPVTIWIKQTKATTRGVYVKIGGKATAWKHKPVMLQKKRNGVFRTIDRNRTNDRGQYSFRKFLRTGTHRFRVKVPKGNGYAASYSPVAGGTVTS